MKIATYNVNSIRKRLPIVLEWLQTRRPDIMGLQETKVEDAAFPADAFRDAGYHVTFRGQKGYNGVATLTLAEPTEVVYGFKIGRDPEDVRVLTLTAGGVTVVNTYVPQGTRSGRTSTSTSSTGSSGSASFSKTSLTRRSRPCGSGI